ncbi:MAG: hypothetical protein JWR72_1751 [Flavisolibacter sp.]|nr:hypothetical protein [Flavisolibacter sp.]
MRQSYYFLDLKSLHMKKVIQVSRYLLLASFLFLYSCKKNTEELKAGDVAKTELMAKVRA